jgi:DNA helicase-2/ATP-dependent DNA helicase PcrA
MHLYASLSRFIPPEVAALFERVGSVAAAAPPLVAAEPAAPVIDLRARLGSAWD